MTVAPCGHHLIADLEGCPVLDDPALIERAMRAAVDAAGATLLDLRLHHFGPAQGVTGVALLAESHISIHSWPEQGYAAIDIFMCGGREAVHRALEVMRRHLEPARVAVRIVERGVSLPAQTYPAADAAEPAAR
jgi:S-adenosylmethionine decarboxylase